MKMMKTIAIVSIAGFAAVAGASSAELRARTVQFGQGPPITYFEPVASSQGGTGGGREGRPNPQEQKGHWKTYRPPNGPAITYWVVE